MSASISFAPLFGWPVLFGFSALVLVVIAFGAMRRLSGWWLRALAASVVLAALANPSYQVEDRSRLPDVVLAVVDRTASQSVSDRSSQLEMALEATKSRIARLPNTELQIVELTDADDDRGTLLKTRLTEALSRQPENQIAGAILITDGQAHDQDITPIVPAPLHVFLTGHSDDWDRRLVIKNAPAFGILDEPLILNVRIEDQGDVPPGLPNQVPIRIAIGNGEEVVLLAPIGQDFLVPFLLEHGGVNVIQVSLDEAPNELTTRNNSAVLRINGVRDRLRVLLVSGEPYQGERTWRNLLKSDSSVDLVHFTILRPPQKQDRVPVSELALIAFPTRELFLEKVNDFDLIIFDRYRRRGILPSLYLENIRQYVENGGAVLIGAGPAFAGAESLFRSPLGAIIPATPTSRLIEGGYLPDVTEIGNRHPVTQGMKQHLPGDSAEPNWGRWFRQVEVEGTSGETVMSGAEGLPLLVLDRVGEGRIALLASDHAWLWSRGFEGGGPQQELLRRLAHWMMGEPELEEEALVATSDGQSMTVTRQTLGDGQRSLEITGPDGATIVIEMSEVAPGKFQAEFAAPALGLYELKEGDQDTVVALGPSSPREFEETVATELKLVEVVQDTRGGVFRIEEGIPSFRSVRPGRVAAGRGWLGLTPRNAYETKSISSISLVPAWLLLLIAAAFSVLGWMREGRR